MDSRSQSLSDVTFEFHAFLKHPVKPTVCSTKSETIRLHIGIQISIIINDLVFLNKLCAGFAVRIWLID